MTIAEKHVRHYNSLNGKRINKVDLVKFHAQLKRDIITKKIDAHVQYGVECIEIEKRISKAITQMAQRSVLIKCEPVKIHKPKVTIKQTDRGPEVVKKPVKKTKVVKPAKSKREIKRPLPPVERKERNKVPAQRFNKPKSVRSHSLNGVVDAATIRAMQFTRIDLDDKYKEDFLKIYSDTLILVWGKPGSGKTVYLLKLGQYFAEKKNLKVLYIANEEYGRSTFTEKLNEFDIGHPNLKFVKSLKMLKDQGHKVEDYDVVFFDSVNSMKMSLDDFKQFNDDYPGIIKVLIVQSTKDGDFKGGKEWEHEVDIAGEVKNKVMVLRKNRFDQSFAARSEEIHLNDAIEQRKRRELINQKAKGQPKEQELTITA